MLTEVVLRIPFPAFLKQCITFIFTITMNNRQSFD